MRSNTSQELQDLQISWSERASGMRQFGASLDEDSDEDLDAVDAGFFCFFIWIIAFFFFFTVAAAAFVGQFGRIEVGRIVFIGPLGG